MHKSLFWTCALPACADALQQCEGKVEQIQTFCQPPSALSPC